MKTLQALALLGFALFVSGCSTVDNRIKEKSAVFASLDPQAQARLKQGLIDIGYTMDMVYIALGKPDEVREKTSVKGQNTTWIFKNYWQEYQGSTVVGYHRYVYYDATAKAYRVYYEPVRTEIYRARSEERTRVTFVDGHVTAIEQAKD